MTSITAVETSRSMKLIALPDVVRLTIKHLFFYKTTIDKRDIFHDTILVYSVLLYGKVFLR